MRQLPVGAQFTPGHLSESVQHQAASSVFTIGSFSQALNQIVTSVPFPYDQTAGSQRHGNGCTSNPQSRTELHQVVDISDGHSSTKASATAPVAMSLCLPNQFYVPTRGLSLPLRRLPCVGRVISAPLTARMPAAGWGQLARHTPTL